MAISVHVTIGSVDRDTGTSPAPSRNPVPVPSSIAASQTLTAAGATTIATTLPGQYIRVTCISADGAAAVYVSSPAASPSASSIREVCLQGDRVEFRGCAIGSKIAIATS